MMTKGDFEDLKKGEIIEIDDKIFLKRQKTVVIINTVANIGFGVIGARQF